MLYRLHKLTLIVASVLAIWASSTVAVSSEITSTPAPKNHLKEGFQAVKDRDWKAAVTHFETAQQSKPLTMQALLALAYAYRRTEECSKAVVPLNQLDKMSKGRKLSKREAKIARSGMFLLARCYAKQNDAGKALYILNGYLLDPKKYASEIRQSLRLIDFGGLKTQSDFRDYMKAAQKALSKVPRSESFPSYNGDTSSGDYDKPADPGSSASGF